MIYLNTLAIFKVTDVQFFKCHNTDSKRALTVHCQQYANVKFSSNRSCRELGTVTRLKVLDRAYSTDSIGHTCCT